MGEIKKFVNGEFAGNVGDFEGNILGQPFLCVCGENEPRTGEGQEVITWPLCEGLSAYIRFNVSQELADHIAEFEGIKMDGSIVLTKQLMMRFNLDFTKILMQAIDFMGTDGVEAESMIDFMVNNGMPKEFVEIIPSDDPQRKIMIVRTKHHFGQYGAGVLANTAVMGALRNDIGDFYIIPASIHEVIIIPKTIGDNIEDKAGMVKEVNQTVIDPRDVLSDNIYAYDEKGLHRI